MLKQLIAHEYKKAGIGFAGRKQPLNVSLLLKCDNFAAMQVIATNALNKNKKTRRSKTKKLYQTISQSASSIDAYATLVDEMVHSKGAKAAMRSGFLAPTVCQNSINVFRQLKTLQPELLMSLIHRFISEALCKKLDTKALLCSVGSMTPLKDQARFLSRLLNSVAKLQHALSENSVYHYLAGDVFVLTEGLQVICRYFDSEVKDIAKLEDKALELMAEDAPKFKTVLKESKEAGKILSDEESALLAKYTHCYSALSGSTISPVGEFSDANLQQAYENYLIHAQTFFEHFDYCRFESTEADVQNLSRIIKQYYFGGEPDLQPYTR